jgi:hypothetical protein
MEGLGRQGGQCLQVVAQHFGCEIVHHSPLGQSRNMLEA